MPHRRVDRRDFMSEMVLPAAALSVLPRGVLAAADGPIVHEAPGPAPGQGTRPARIKFGVVGINHNHINGMTDAVIRGGGELVWIYAHEADLVDAFRKRYPQAKLARSEQEVLEDASIQLVLSSIVPEQRAPLGIRVMQHGKDYLADKPGITTLAQLAEVRRVQAATKRIYSILYSERFENRATVRAEALVKAGAIGHVVQTVGLGPHRITPSSRPAWFWEKARYGGILVDIASHQAAQFLTFTSSTRADVVASQVGNVHWPQHPEFEDFGDMLLRGDAASGYVRVDWFTPDGLSTWGDGRLTVIGTEGFLEIRKNVDIGGRPGESHLFLVDQKETRYIDCSNVELPFGPQFVSDIVDRTETAMAQKYCLSAMEIVLQAQQQAHRLTYKM